MADSDKKAGLRNDIAKYEDYEDSIDDAIDEANKIESGLSEIDNNQYEKVKENITAAIGSQEDLLDKLKFRYTDISTINDEILEELNYAKEHMSSQIEDIKDKIANMD